jgi:hypothetical protein
VESGKLARKSFNNLLNLLHAVIAWARQPAQSYLSHDPLVGQKRLKREPSEREFLETWRRDRQTPPFCTSRCSPDCAG